MPFERLIARLTHPTWSAARWYEAYSEARRTMNTVETDPFDERKFDRAYDLHVRAIWALSTFGTESLPYALQLLHSADPNDRANAASILEASADDPAAIDALIHLAGDENVEAGDAAIVFLGRTRSAAAVSALEAILADETRDADTRDLARHALESIRRGPSRSAD